MKQLRRRFVHWLEHGTWQCHGSITTWDGRDGRIWIALVCHQCGHVVGAHPIPEHVFP